MASIRRRPNARGHDSFAVLFRAGGRQRSETFRGRGAEAEAAKFAALVDRIGGAAASEIRSAYRHDDDARAMPTVAEWVRHHIDHLSGVTDGTRSDYRSYVRLSLDQHILGSLPVDVVTTDHVTRWVNDLTTQGLAGKSIRNRHALLSAAFARAVVDRLRGDNPAKSVAIPTTVTEEMTTLTHGEFAVLLGHVPRHWQPLVATLAGTGLRFGEATALQVRDMHLDDTPPTLTVSRAWKHTDSKARELGPPKTRRGRRTVSLGGNLATQLRPLVEGRPHDAFVFTTRRGRPVRHSDFLASVWQVAVASATLTTDAGGNPVPADRRITKRPRLHDLRHTHASWMLAQGMSLTELQYRLGHESIKTTSDRYVHLMPGHQDRAAVMAEIALAQALPELERSAGE